MSDFMFMDEFATNFVRAKNLKREQKMKKEEKKVMTMSQIQEWADARVTTPIVTTDCRATEKAYINRITYKNGEAYEFQDIEGRGITIKINGNIVYQQ